MQLKQLEREVAEVTGETVSEIRRRGFSLADPDDVAFDPEPCDVSDQFLDWDELQQIEPPRRCHQRRREPTIV